MNEIKQRVTRGYDVTILSIFKYNKIQSYSLWFIYTPATTATAITVKMMVGYEVSLRANQDSHQCLPVLLIASSFPVPRLHLPYHSLTIYRYPTSPFHL